jgi:L-fuconolactonase
VPVFPIVDSHVHLADPGQFDYAWTVNAPSLKRRVLPHGLMKAAAPVEIEAFVFVEVDVDLPQHVAEAKWVDGLARSQPRDEPRLKGMVAALPLERGRSVEPELEELLKLKSLRGIRRLIQNQPDPDFCIRPDFIAGLKLLAPHDIAFDICVFHHHLPNVIRMVRACPEVRFVLDHIGKPAIKAGTIDPWRADLKELASYENVYCKISGVTTEADHKKWTREQLKPYVAHAIESFGFDRSMYGGDWHVLELAGTYPQWVEIVDWIVGGASADEKRKLYRHTAIDFYRLNV